MVTFSQLSGGLPIARLGLGAAGAVILWPDQSFGMARGQSAWHGVNRHGTGSIGMARGQSAWHGVNNIQAQLLWGLLFGSVGLGYFIYGRKQKAVVPLVCGLALVVFPYFVSNVALLVGIGVLLTAIPYFFRL
jgi:hypothetical protein